jgi:hypothetical protein
MGHRGGSAAGLAEHRRTQFIELRPDTFDNLPVAFRGWRDPEGAQEFRSRSAGIAALAENGMQSFAR